MRRILSCNVWLGSLVVILVAASGEPSASGAEFPSPTGESLKYEEPRFLSGAIYDQEADGAELLFTFERKANRVGDTLNVERDFIDITGRPAARERVVYDGSNLVLYEFKELQTGAEGSARIQRDPGNSGQGRIEFEYREIGAQPKRTTEDLTQDTLINDMVAPFLASHWDALVRGEKVRCRYIVVPRSQTVGFTFVKVSKSTSQGREVMLVKMAASSVFVSALVKPLFFTIEWAAPHRVLSYTGRTTPMINEGGRWKDLDAVTRFDWSSAR